MNLKTPLAALLLCAAPAYAQADPTESVKLTPALERDISAAALAFTGQPCVGEYTADRVPGRFTAEQFAEAAAGAKTFTEDFRAFLPQTRVLFDTDNDHLTRFALLGTALPLFSQQERRSDGVYTLGCTVTAPAKVSPPGKPTAPNITPAAR